MTKKKRITLAAVGSFGALSILAGYNYITIRFNGEPVAVPDIPRQAKTIGSGPKLQYVILGDSTAVGQGGTYSKGIAVHSAEVLASKNQVTYQNLAVSGARMNDVLQKQLPTALTLKPDVILLSVSANDVVHLTSQMSAKLDFLQIIQQLEYANPDIKIVISGAAEVDASPRFTFPVNTILKNRVNSYNDMFASIVASDKHLYFAPIAERTGEAFYADDSLFAVDKFHPNDRGYALWNEVIAETLESIDLSS